MTLIELNVLIGGEIERQSFNPDYIVRVRSSGSGFSRVTVAQVQTSTSGSNVYEFPVEGTYDHVIAIINGKDNFYHKYDEAFDRATGNHIQDVED